MLILFVLSCLAGQFLHTFADIGCRQIPGDVVFLLETSDDMGLSGFDEEMAFLAKLINFLDVGPRYVHVGVVTYAHTPRTEMNLGNYQTKTAVLEAVYRMWKSIGKGDIEHALQYVHANVFVPAKGDRPNAPNILIIVTNDRVGNPVAMRNVSRALANSGVNTFIIGVGPNFNRSDFVDLTTNVRMYTIDGFSQLDVAALNIYSGICSELTSLMSVSATPPPNITTT